MRIEVIVNPVSGRHGSRPAKVASVTSDAMRTLGRLGADATLRFTERPGHATELARAAIASGADRVIAWGGDGTVNEIAAALAFSSLALAIVPAGSGNGLARELGVALDAPRALRVAVEGEVRAVDLGELDRRYFVNVAGVGFDAHVARVFNDERRGRLGLGSYVRISLREFVRYSPCACRVIVGGEVIDARPLMIAIANSAQYGNGARIAPSARIDDGLLDVVVVERTWALRDVLRARRLFTGTMEKDRATRVRRAPFLRIEGDGPLPAHVDGQPFQAGRVLEAQVHRNALRVVCPPGSRA